MKEATIDKLQEETLVPLSKARQWLAKAKTIKEIKKIADIAHAAKVYAKKAKLSRECKNDAAELEIRAERRLGEMLKETERAKGKRTDLVTQRNQVKDKHTLDDLGITKKLSSRAQMIADVPGKKLVDKTTEELGQMGNELHRMVLENPDQLSLFSKEDPW